jgi:hypothetical protein
VKGIVGLSKTPGMNDDLYDNLLLLDHVNKHFGGGAGDANQGPENFYSPLKPNIKNLTGVNQI